MTDPIQPGPPGSEENVAADLAAKQAAAGMGTTEADIGALIAHLQAQMEVQAQQIETLLSQRGPQGEHPLVATAVNLRYHLSDMEHSEAHKPALGLADDLVEAAKAAAESGELGPVRAIVQRLERWNRRVRPRPGDDHHGRQAAEIIGDHLADQLDAFVPTPRRPGIASDRPPVPVVSGSVVG
jgi:hypothetical protein